MMETGYQQAQEDDSFSLDEVFDQIEASISSKELSDELDNDEE